MCTDSRQVLCVHGHFWPFLYAQSTSSLCPWSLLAIPVRTVGKFSVSIVISGHSCTHSRQVLCVHGHCWPFLYAPSTSSPCTWSLLAIPVRTVDKFPVSTVTACHFCTHSRQVLRARGHFWPFLYAQSTSSPCTWSLLAIPIRTVDKFSVHVSLLTIPKFEATRLLLRQFALVGVCLRWDPRNTIRM
jgi:hypothetical protein